MATNLPDFAPEPQPAQPYHYPQAYHPVTPQLVRPTSGVAVASMIAGIIGVLGGWCLFGIPCIVAVILGHIAWRSTKSGMLNGHGMTVAGLVMGYLFVIPGIIFTLMGIIGSFAQ